VLDAVVGGSAVAFLAGTLGAATWVAVVLGAVVSAVSAVVMTRWQARFHRSADATTESLFPSP
jgi:membrane protein implicated in regulation of membrane protease activity